MLRLLNIGYAATSELLSLSCVLLVKVHEDLSEIFLNSHF